MPLCSFFVAFLGQAGSGIVDDEMVALLCFKDMLRCVASANNNVLGADGAWPEDVLSWMQTSVDVCVAVSDFKKAQLGKGFDVLAKSAKVLHSLLTKMSDMEMDWQTQRLGEQMDPLASLLNFTWCEKAKNLMQDPEYLDKIEVTISQGKHEANVILRNITKATKNFLEDYLAVNFVFGLDLVGKSDSCASPHACANSS